MSVSLHGIEHRQICVPPDRCAISSEFFVAFPEYCYEIIGCEILDVSVELGWGDIASFSDRFLRRFFASNTENSNDNFGPTPICQLQIVLPAGI